MEILQKFGIQPILLLAQIVNFVIILLILKKFFYKPIVKILEDRKKRIEESLKNADLIEEKLQKTEEQSVRILEQAKDSAQILIAGAKAEAQKISEQATVEARQTIEHALIEAKIQIEAERLMMQKQLERQTLKLVIEVVRKILARSLKTTERQDLTSRAISQLTKQVQ